MFAHDLAHPDYDPADCPAWAKETLPPDMAAFRGRNGLPDVYRERQWAIALTVRGIDRYHANQFVVYRPETAHYLYHDYTPLEVNYTKGLLPSYEALAESSAAGAKTAREKVLCFLKNALPVFPHPATPPLAPWAERDRNLDDEALLASGSGWCNEQARVFIRLCQASGIPARIVQLFYSDCKTGHCIAEFYADGKWCMADASYWIVFPDSEGRLLSAAECHTAEGRKVYARIHHQRRQELLAQSDEALRFRTPEQAAESRGRIESETEAFFEAQLNCFGIINYLLPYHSQDLRKNH